MQDKSAKALLSRFEQDSGSHLDQRLFAEIDEISAVIE